MHLRNHTKFRKYWPKVNRAVASAFLTSLIILVHLPFGLFHHDRHYSSCDLKRPTIVEESYSQSVVPSHEIQKVITSSEHNMHFHDLRTTCQLCKFIATHSFAFIPPLHVDLTLQLGEIKASDVIVEKGYNLSYHHYFNKGPPILG